MQTRIDKTRDHFIVCRLGETGRHAVHELHKTHTPHVVGELVEAHVKRLQELQPGTFGDLLYVFCDANQIGGLRLASELIRPHVVGFLDLMLREGSQTLRVKQIVIQGRPGQASVSLLNLHARYNLLVLATKPSESGMLAVNPPDTLVTQPGMVLIVLGDVRDVQRARGGHRRCLFSDIKRDIAGTRRCMRSHQAAPAWSANPRH